MKVTREMQKEYTDKLLSTIKSSQKPLRIRELVEQVREGEKSLHSDILVGLVWHLLAARKLQFNSTRELSLSGQSTKSRQLVHD